MVKINYVIATYAGYIRRDDSFVKMSEILRSHLIQLHEISHNLSQITIMKAKCTEKQIEGYYNIQDIVDKLDTPVIEIDCENFGYSNGQFLTAYEKYGKEFDYYIFTEDDYCPNMNFFDTFLLKYYNKHLPSNIGKLCSFVQGRPLQKNHVYPIHWTGDIFLSVETLDKLYSIDIFNGKVKQHLDLIKLNKTLIKKEDIILLRKARNRYIGAYYQLIFSYLFHISDIPIIDYLSEKMEFVYWHDNTKQQFGGELLILEKNIASDFSKSFGIIPKQLNVICKNKLTIPVQICKSLTFLIGFDHKIIEEYLKKLNKKITVYNELLTSDMMDISKNINHIFISTNMNYNKWKNYKTFIDNKGCIKYNFIINKNCGEHYEHLLDKNDIYYLSEKMETNELALFLNTVCHPNFPNLEQFL